MNKILEILKSIGLTILAFIGHLIVWAPVFLIFGIITMISWFITPWLGILFLVLTVIFIVIKFLVDVFIE